MALVTRFSRQPRWIPHEVLFEQLAEIQADAGLAADIARLAPETTDDLDPL